MVENKDGVEVEKHVIVILSYEGEKEDSKTKIKKEAENIESKLKGKGYDVTLKKTQREFNAWMRDGTGSKGLDKIHIVAHGNQEVCGDYNAVGLADYIYRFIKGKRELKAITIHSCMSASDHPTHGIFVRQFASKLLTHLKGDFSQYIVVRGSDGESYTDSTGTYWVLKAGVEIPEYKTREREEGFLKDNTKPRGTARPRYAISNNPGYSGVDPV
jgi:hypothetical protein